MSVYVYFYTSYWASKASPTLTSTIEIEIPPHADIYIYMSRKMRGTLLRESAMYCVGVAERSGTAQSDPLPKRSFWVKDLTMR